MTPVTSALQSVVDRYTSGAAAAQYSLQPLETANLSDNDRKLLENLDAFEAPWLEEKLLKSGTFAAKDDCKQAFAEFKKYVALCDIFGKPFPMPSETIDAVWHQLILFTQKYADFCQNTLGRFMHHNPTTSYTPLSSKATVEDLQNAYMSVFGKPPAIWSFGSNADCNIDCDPYQPITCDSDPGDD